MAASASRLHTGKLITVKAGWACRTQAKFGPSHPLCLLDTCKTVRARGNGKATSPDLGPFNMGSLGQAERKELRDLIEGYPGFGLLSLIRALIYSGGCRNSMLALVGIVLLVGQWAGPVGFIAFKLQNEDLTQCNRNGGLWARFVITSVAMIYFARMLLASLAHRLEQPAAFDAFKMPKWWRFYRHADNIVTNLLYDTFIFVSNLLIVFQDRSVDNMVVDVLALEFFTMIDDQFKTAVLEYDSSFLYHMVSARVPSELHGPRRESGGAYDIEDPSTCCDVIADAAYSPIYVILLVVRAAIRIGGPLFAFLMMFYGPYCLGVPGV